jgi:hypothetical protein
MDMQRQFYQVCAAHFFIVTDKKSAGFAPLASQLHDNEVVGFA